MLAPRMTEPTSDTIPRLHRVIDHAHDQLVGIADGQATFEECRVRYGHTQKRLEREGRGRVTQSRMRDDERNWAPTRDALSELMRWGAVEQDRLPSARSFLGSYRDRSYRLTPYGEQLATAALEPDKSFVDHVAQAIIGGHAHVRALLSALKEGPVVCPAIEGGDVERGRQHQLGTDGWGAWAAPLIGSGTTPKAVAASLRTHLRRRFGENPPERPTNKAISEAMNDAFAVAGFAARGITLDATSIKTLLRWGSELLLYDQSRYVPAHPDCNAIWLAADLDSEAGDAPRPQRRGLGRYGPVVAREVVAAYRHQVTASESTLAAPYLPIHAVRAEAAYTSGTTRALVDLVLSQLADDGYSELGVTVLTHIGTSALPESEPAFRHHGRRRLEITITDK